MPFAQRIHSGVIQRVFPDDTWSLAARRARCHRDISLFQPPCLVRCCQHHSCHTWPVLYGALSTAVASPACLVQCHRDRGCPTGPVLCGAIGTPVCPTRIVLYGAIGIAVASLARLVRCHRDISLSHPTRSERCHWGVGNYAVYPQPSSGMLRQLTVRPLNGLAIERVWGLAAVL